MPAKAGIQLTRDSGLNDSSPEPRASSFARATARMLDPRLRGGERSVEFLPLQNLQLWFSDHISPLSVSRARSVMTLPRSARDTASMRQNAPSIPIA